MRKNGTEMEEEARFQRDYQVAGTLNENLILTFFNLPDKK